jgi:hypothetical protein
MRGKVLVVGIKLKTYGGHTRFVDGLLGSGLPYDFVHFNPARPPKDRSVSLRRAGYHELLDAGLGRAALGAAITLYHLLVFPFILLRERPTVVHLAGSTFWQFWEFALYIAACRLLGRKCIYHWLASYVDFHQRSGKLGLALLRFASRMADRHIVQSSIDYAYLTKLVLARPAHGHDDRDSHRTAPGAAPDGVDKLLADERLVGDHEQRCRLLLAHACTSSSASRAPPERTAWRAPGTPYSYGPPTICGISSKLKTGGGEDTCHSRVLARHGFASAMGPRTQLWLML